MGVIGAGTMGAGIAQVAAAAGWTVQLKDIDEATVTAAIAGIGRRYDRLVEKGRMTPADRDAAFGRLLAARCPKCLAGCRLIIEAVVEDLEVKTAVLGELIPALSPGTLVSL